MEARMTRRFRHADEVWQTFPSLRAGALVCDGIRVDADVDASVRERTAVAARRAEHVPESELPEIRAWRRAYAQMGLKPTQYRCAAESLLRRIRTHGDLPRLHPLVDLCNAVSAARAIPIAVLDLDRVDGDLTVRPASGAETYVTLSGDVEHPAVGEIVYADDAGSAHSRRWVTRQSGRSAVTPATRRVLVVVEAVHDSAAIDVGATLDELAERIGRTWHPAHHRMLTAVDPAIDLGR